jgi:hypothetical protein
MIHMETTKFTAEDRRLVIQELEKIQQSKLTPLKSSRKLFTDEKGMLYFLFGGTGNWHGIRPSALEKLKGYSKEGAFVIAKKYKSRIDLCVGPLAALIRSKHKLPSTQNGDLQFHSILTEDGMYLLEIPDVYLNKVSEIKLPGFKRDLSRLEEISKIINIEIDSKAEVTHSDLQAKLILIGSYLGFRTYTPDKSKQSIYGVLGELCSEDEVPEASIPKMHFDTVKFIDVLWFDEEGFPTHGFEVEHTTDITKGLLRLYQVHKLRIKMFIVAKEESREKFKREIQKNPFYTIQQEYIFKNYEELDEFFESVKSFTKAQNRFLKAV